jgi:hypothetical protein
MTWQSVALLVACLVISACNSEQASPRIVLTPCQSCAGSPVYQFSTNPGGHPGAPEVTIAEFTTTIVDASDVGGNVTLLTIEYRDRFTGDSGAVTASAAQLREGMCGRPKGYGYCDIKAVNTTLIPPRGQLELQHQLYIGTELFVCVALSIHVTAVIEDTNGHTISASGDLALESQC